MANRTTSTKVKDILKVDPSIDVEPFITTANILVTDYIVGECDPNYSTNTLELIERWLAAHFYSIRDQLLHETETGKARGIFQGQTRMKLSATTYGQQALMLDYKGCLQKLDDRKGGGTMKLEWLGTDPDD